MTYGGHALYTYGGDTKAGEANSQGLKLLGAKWFVVGAQLSAITRPRQPARRFRQG